MEMTMSHIAGAKNWYPTNSALSIASLTGILTPRVWRNSTIIQGLSVREVDDVSNGRSGIQTVVRKPVYENLILLGKYLKLVRQGSC